MKMVTMNFTDQARKAAGLIGRNFFESHRGASRYWMADTEETFCVLMYGNDGYTKTPDSDPEIHARTVAYVHNLYAGLANLLPEGGVEFGTDEGGITWAILAHFPRSSDDFASHRAADVDNQDEDEDEDDDSDDDGPLVACWNEIVWAQWKSQLSCASE
jgi:hypothetical protein